MPTLVVDSGNTRIHWRLRVAADTSIEGYGSYENPFVDLVHELNQLPGGLEAVAVSCLRPDLKDTLARELSMMSTPQPIWILSGADLPKNVGTDQPGNTGADRALCAKAWCDRPGSHAAIVIDAGTAVTVDAVSQDGVLLGGWIAPGWAAVRQSLHDRAPRLPFGSEVADPGFGWATESKVAIEGGIRGLFRGGVQELHERIKRGWFEEGVSDPVTVITGGDAALLEGLFSETEWVSGLVLDGLESCLRDKEL
ncbi:MAG: type III pantothenate kinase [Planctomycetota bacterium]|nr:type III pantothenate kinase [Planctomycetota bacterium]